MIEVWIFDLLNLQPARRTIISLELQNCISVKADRLLFILNLQKVSLAALESVKMKTLKEQLQLNIGDITDDKRISFANIIHHLNHMLLYLYYLFI